ncbi:MAG: hypothetical protein IJS60_07705 [Abditibacteriota bacterium]|nr:hypothetical protein [Abditibacteriota bacterium]
MKYTGKNTQEISFPLGGIGTGSIGFTGNGRLWDWEIYNRPNKDSINGYSHFSIKVEDENRVLDIRALNSDYNKSYQGTTNGSGVPNQSMAGVPHFKDSEFIGEYPIATINFMDDTFPGKVSMTAFNPLIPQNSKDSSIPCACFIFKVLNDTDKPLTYQVTGMLGNPAFQSSKHEVSVKENLTTITMFPGGKSKNKTIEAGNMSLSAIGDNLSYQQFSFRGRWFDTINVYWDDLNKFGPLKNRVYDEIRDGVHDHALVASSIKINPGEEREFKFIITWYYPIFYKYWYNPIDPDDMAFTPRPADYDFEEDTPRWKNYYATVWESSNDVAKYVYGKWDKFYKYTKLFKDTLFASTLPSYIIDGVSANISVLRSPTTSRLETGEFYAFEGSFAQDGACEGICQHVWNYAYAMPFLFPDLERSIREVMFDYSYDNGRMGFRVRTPLGIGVTKFRACVDGQMGEIIKSYREWKISGDDEWLRKYWDRIKGAMDYAWSENNADKWDYDKDGLLEGRQHHTLDMELFGPSSWLQGFYTLALKACIEMADYLGDNDKAKEYKEMFEKAKTCLNTLFNGKYFIQKIDLKNKDFYKYYDEKVHQEIIDTYWDSEHEEIKYQIGEGSIIDQCLAQWHANNVGLGKIFDEDKLHSACESLYNINFKKSMRDVFNPNRVFALNDEKGTLICNYPKNVYRPVIPIVYSEECMNGFEYSNAILLMQEGFLCEGLEMFKAVRDKYQGFNRNPWDEMECGNNYARSMASFSALNTLSGFKYDMAKKFISFNPVELKDINMAWDEKYKGLELYQFTTEKKNYFWSVGKAWGNIEINLEENKATLNVLYGEIEINELSVMGQLIEFVDGVKLEEGESIDLEFDFE